MNIINAETLPIYQFSILQQYLNIKHYVSSRKGGVSRAPEYQSLNMSLGSGDVYEYVIENRKLVANTIGIDSTQLVFPNFSHSNNVKVIDEFTKLDPITQNHPDLTNTDGLVTKMKNVCISVLGADCVPLIFYDPVKHVAGVAHAGWRGTVNKIAQNTVRLMQNQYECVAKDIVVCIGPSIGPDAYEVGTDVIEAVLKTFGTKEGLILNENSKTGKGYLDLWEANRRQLIDIGIVNENIQVAGICTYNQHENFFSSRRLKKVYGRFGDFAAGIMLL
eukprot:TRINITY_DN6611_c0_g2_i1.p1 TRINITY_DN6611_c0_g2~~TRINITY_DN6611_c0_g2_i1.p1  ORF type:complete len:285 (-),score=19.46 TRINITY_DN6611_c0_g2_i1:72-899(-)